MGLYAMGAASSADKETRILELKSYLNLTRDYNSLVALKKAHVYSWTTMLSYLNSIKRNYQDSLTDQGKMNWKIAYREAEMLKKANAKAKRHQR